MKLSDMPLGQVKVTDGQWVQLNIAISFPNFIWLKPAQNIQTKGAASYIRGFKK